MYSDLWLIFRCQRGDPNAFSALYNQYKNKVFQTAFYFVRDRALAEDITQEVFIGVFEKIKDLRSPSAFRTWLYRIAVSKTTRALRGEGGKRNIPLDDSFEYSDTSHDPLAEAVNQAEIDSLRAEIRNLPDELRLPVMLYYFDELSIKEVADVMEIPQGTVKSRLHTARARLTTALNPESPNMRGIFDEEVSL